MKAHWLAVPVGEWFQQHRHWRRRGEAWWLQDHRVIRWGLPVLVAVLSGMMGALVFSTTPSADGQQLQALEQSNAAKRAKWLEDEPVRQREQALKEAVLAWQTGLRWREPSPWLQWPALAQPLGVRLSRVHPVSTQTMDHHVQHTVALQGTGRLNDIDALWREWGRRGWWVTLVSMRMSLTPDGTSSWQAQWALNQGLPLDAPLKLPPNSQPSFIKSQWAERWLNEGGPDVAQAHAGVAVVTPLKVEEGWTLASLSNPLRPELAVPAPWPHTPWEQMRLVGHWMRGQQVVALVAVDDVVHAVVPGMRLGPQRHEVVQVTNEGVWVAPASSGGPARRVLHWVDRPGGEDS
jgi:hypothetical protein